METAIMGGISKFPIDEITLSTNSSQQMLCSSPVPVKVVRDRNSIVSIQFERARASYPRWLQLLATFTFLLIVLGFMAGVIGPSAIAGVFFPTGLVGVWLVGKLASRRYLPR